VETSSLYLCSCGDVNVALKTTAFLSSVSAHVGLRTYVSASLHCRTDKMAAATAI